MTNSALSFHESLSSENLTEPYENKKREEEILFFDTGPELIAQDILKALPNWFDDHEIENIFIPQIVKIPMIVGYQQNNPVGFISLKLHSKSCAEVFAMGVLPQYHRFGWGSILLRFAENHLSKEGVEFLQVKTVSSDHPSLYFKKTRNFYFKHGFKELEVFPLLWNKDDPCLMMIKSIKKTLIQVA